MQCPSCKARLRSGTRFCGVCGHKLPPGQSGFTQDDEGATEIDPQERFVQEGGDAPVRPALADSGDPYVGMVLNNRFKVQEKLGEGGFGAVYRGVQTGTGRKVALKLLHPDMTRDDNLVARFRREGMVLCNLRDAHTVTTYDFDQTPDGTLYIAMELLEGKSLHEVFESDAPLAWRRMFKILTEMCSSLAEAHAQGIVHRDLKPENIYLEARHGHPDFVKILDFGIAKVMRGDGISGKPTQLTATGQTLGTLEYMSPEQLMGKPLDGRSDIYALGVLVYEMITGRLPFPNAKGPAGLITAQLRQVPDPPSVANPAGNIPASVDAVVARMLAKDRNSRHADVSELRDAINEILAAEAHEARGAAPTPLPGPASGGASAGQPRAASVPAPGGQGPAGGPAAPHGAMASPPMTVASMSGESPGMHGAGMQGQTPPGMHRESPGMHGAGMQGQAPGMYGAGMQGQAPGMYGAGMHGSEPMPPMMQPSYPMPMGSYAPQGHGYAPPAQATGGSRRWLWIAIAIIALGSVVGAIVAFT